VKVQPSLGGIFMSGIWMFWLEPQQPATLWQNGWYRRIRHIKLV
jgi:hypothetical protein